MVSRKKEGSLTREEKRIVKALLNAGQRNQDIQALINSGRKNTINSARITAVKQDDRHSPASNEEVEFFVLKKRSYDPVTGLNRFEHERLNHSAPVTSSNLVIDTKRFLSQRSSENT